jgi:hypothetical protein
MSSIGDENDSKNENDTAQNNTIATSKFCILHGLPKFKIIKEIQQLKFLIFFLISPPWIIELSSILFQDSHISIQQHGQYIAIH